MIFLAVPFSVQDPHLAVERDSCAAGADDARQDTVRPPLRAVPFERAGGATVIEFMPRRFPVSRRTFFDDGKHSSSTAHTTPKLSVLSTHGSTGHCAYNTSTRNRRHGSVWKRAQCALVCGENLHKSPCTLAFSTTVTAPIRAKLDPILLRGQIL